MKLFSVCPTCVFEPKPYDGERKWGDFDRCAKCGAIMNVWTESGVRNEQARQAIDDLIKPVGSTS